MNTSERKFFGVKRIFLDIAGSIMRKRRATKETAHATMKKTSQLEQGTDSKKPPRP